jgi:hypothetical protein
MSRTLEGASRLFGEPFLFPTRAQMRRWTEAAGFRVGSQRAILRLPLPLAFPSVVTHAVRPV